MTDERVDDELEGDPARPPWTFFGETFPRWLLRRRQERVMIDYGLCHLGEAAALLREEAAGRRLPRVASTTPSAWAQSSRFRSLVR